MATFTKDYNEADPASTDQARDGAEEIRDVKIDLSDRLKTLIYGFIAGENDGKPGCKNLIFKQQSSAPSTPNADEIELYALDDGSNCGLFTKQEDGYTKQLLKKVGSDINFVVEAADIPADTIDSQHYAAASIDNEHLANDAVDSDELAAGSVDLAHMSANSVDSGQYVDGSIDAEHLAAGACWRHDGTQVHDGAAPESWTDLDLSEYVGSNHALVFLKLKANDSWNYWFRTNGDTEDVAKAYTDSAGCTVANIDAGHIAYFILETDSAGVIEWEAAAAGKDVDLWLMGYIK